MKYKLFPNLILVFHIYCISSEEVIPNKKFYIGAVVEYANIFEETKTPEENIQNNINEYGKFIRDAKQQLADIVVFPEYGLTSTYISDKRREAILYSSEIPNPYEKINPCKESNVKKNNIFPAWSEILTQISCEARKNKIYVVINLSERVKYKYDWILYNTNVVFDRSGTLISRYRKFNLYREPAYSTTITPEIESFTTDFGVTFGTMTCFDILYADPTMSLLKNKKVTDLLYPTAWMSKMPFLTAIETQGGFVKAYGVNLLASNYDNPENSGGGSGIYSPISGILNYTIPTVKRSRMLVSKIPKIYYKECKDVHKKFVNSNIERKETYLDTYLDTYLETYVETYVETHLGTYLETETERWDGFTTEILEASVNSHKICNEELCCKFTVKISKKKSDYFYRLVVTDSYRSTGKDRHHVQICGIVACIDKHLESCGKINMEISLPKRFEDVIITGNFNTDKNYVNFPSLVNYDLSTLSFNSYSYKTTNYLSDTIVLNINRPVENVLGISIYGRSRAN